MLLSRHGQHLSRTICGKQKDKRLCWLSVLCEVLMLLAGGIPALPIRRKNKKFSLEFFLGE